MDAIVESTVPSIPWILLKTALRSWPQRACVLRNISAALPPRCRTQPPFLVGRLGIVCRRQSYRHSRAYEVAAVYGALMRERKYVDTALQGMLSLLDTHLRPMLDHEFPTVD